MEESDLRSMVFSRIAFDRGHSSNWYDVRYSSVENALRAPHAEAVRSRRTYARRQRGLQFLGRLEPITRSGAGCGEAEA